MRESLRKMGIFNFKRKDKKEKKDLFAFGGGKHATQQLGSNQFGRPSNDPWLPLNAPPTFASADLLKQFPPAVTERIFSFVCPHTQDESFETCEQSAPEDRCMLCDLRDLAHCAQVCKRWRNSARTLLYHSVRIDSVHYCEREAYLAEARKRRTRFDRNGEPEDTPAARLKLLCRTLREDPTRLGARVRFFKTPYMVREAAQADLARTIAVLPNLLYVDLPEGLFADDPSYATLRLEVEARCPNLQKMTYRGGAERSLSRLSSGSIWSNLQVLELIRVNMDPAVLRHALGALHNLRALKMTESKAFTDDIFAHDEMLPPFPAVEQLVLTKMPGITAAGLVGYLTSDLAVRATLSVLSLNKTGVELNTLHEVLAVATSLKSLVVQAKVSVPFKSGPNTQRLSSPSLETLRYEITGDPQGSPYSGVVRSYYTYLASSVLGGGLKTLRAVYVIDEDFPDQLQGLPPPMPRAPFAQGHRPSSSGGSGLGGAGGMPMAPFAQGHRPSSSGGSGFSGGMSPSSPRGANFLIPPSGGANPAAALQPPQLPFAPSSGGGGGAGGGSGQNTNRFSSNNPFAGTGVLTHTLEIFTKKDEAMNWSFVKVQPTASIGSGPAPSARFSMMSIGSGGGGAGVPIPGGGGGAAGDRPSSSYGLGAESLGAGWNTAGARRSVMVGNGAGGFVPVPTPETENRLTPNAAAQMGGDDEELWPRPVSSSGNKRGDRDMWR